MRFVEHDAILDDPVIMRDVANRFPAIQILSIEERRRRTPFGGLRTLQSGRGFAGCGALAGEWDDVELGSGSGKPGDVAGDVSLLLMGVPPVARVGHGARSA